MTSIRFGHPRQTTFELGTRPYLESLRLLSGENKEEIPLKSHRELAEIILTEKGHCKLLTQDKVIPVSEGSLILIGQGILHGLKAPQSCSLLSIHIGSLHYRGLLPGTFVKKSVPLILTIGPDQLLISQLMQNIKLLRLMPDSELRNETAASLTQTLTALLPALIQSQGTTPAQEPSALGQRIKEYIDEHYLEDLKLPMIAAALHINTYYLSHTFKALTGASPMQYIIRRRIDQAQNLLLTTNYSVTDIAMQCGYNNSNYFQSVFSNLVGMPPGKYRKAWKQN